MDDDLQDLELELHRLRPRQPSEKVINHIEATLASVPARPASLGWLRWTAFPIAAALAVTFFLNRRPSAPAPALAAAAFKPVSAENLLLDARDEGYITLDDGTPARQIRQTYVDTILWKNSATNASLVWSLPREEIRVLLVDFQ